MEMEDQHSCSRKRRPPVYDFTDSSSDDDDHPPEKMVTPAKKSRVGITGEMLQQPQEEELDARKKMAKSANGSRETTRPSLQSGEGVSSREKNGNQNSLAPPESGKSLLKKLEEDKDSRIVVNGLSTKSAPFKCPSPLSEDTDEMITSSADKKGSHSDSSSPHCPVGDIPGSSSETNASQEDDLDKDEEAISVPEAKEQSKNEAIPENKKRVSGNLPTLLDDDVKNLFRNILESITTFGD